MAKSKIIQYLTEEEIRIALGAPITVVCNPGGYSEDTDEFTRYGNIKEIRGYYRDTISLADFYKTKSLSNPNEAMVFISPGHKSEKSKGLCGILGIKEEESLIKEFDRSDLWKDDSPSRLLAGIKKNKYKTSNK